MKKFVLIATLLISVVANAQISHKEYHDQNKIIFDFGTGVGTYFGGSEPKYTIDMDFTVKNILFGFGFGGEESDGHYKPVHVDSYTRIQNGKTVHVKSYNRAKPGGASDITLVFQEVYFGYWLPIFHAKNFKWHSAPIIGIFNKEQTDSVNGVSFSQRSFPLLYGAGIKITFYDTFGLTLKANNASTTIGISWDMSCLFL